MNKNAFQEAWESRIQDVATDLQSRSGAGAVLVAIFDGPWMDGRDPAIMGLAGNEAVDPRRIARDLRDLIVTLERHVGEIESRQPFAMTTEREKPQRD